MGFFDFLRKLANGFDLEKNTVQNADVQTLFFKNGELYKIVGDKDYWYNPDFVVSDGIKYDMSDAKSIKSMVVPTFGIVNTMSGYGTTGMLDYVLRMKSGVCFDRKEKELCSALLWKSTELMLANKYCAWRNSDYERLIKWHIQLGMDEEAEKAKKFLLSSGIILLDSKSAKRDPKHTRAKETPAKLQKKQRLSTHDRELLLVQSVTTKDMYELTGMPFSWNCEVKKFIKDGGHPFAYMDIVGENIHNVKSALEKMNKQICQDAKTYPNIPKNARIPIDKIVFMPSDTYGYTRIMCTPKTLTGKPAKYPMSLFFCTDLSKTATGGDTTHGELVYDQSGNVAKANIYCWRKSGGFFFRYKTINGQLVLCDTERAGVSIT